MEDFDYQHKKVEILGKKIETYTFGKGERVVVAFPGFPHSGLSFRWLFSKHDLAKIKVITFDMPGWIGESEDYKKGEMFSLDFACDMAKYLLDLHRVDKFSVMGYSFGGAIALKVAADWRENIEKIILVSAVVAPLRFAGLSPIRDVNFLKSWHLRWLMRRIVLKDFRKWKEDLQSQGLPKRFLDKYEKLIENADDRIMMESIYTLFHTDLSGYLDRIKNIKAMIVNSKEEDELFKEQAEIIRRTLIGENSLVVHGAHVDFLLKPNHDVINKIVDFLSED